MDLSLVSIDTSRKLADIQFDVTNEIAIGKSNMVQVYNEAGELCVECDYIPNFHDEEFADLPAPTLDLAAKWFLEMYGIDIEVSASRVIRKPIAEGYVVMIYSPIREMFSWDLGGVHKERDHALEAGILGAIEIVKEILRQRNSEKS